MKILMIVTSHNTLSTSGRKTGCLIAAQNPAFSTSAAEALLKVLNAEAVPA